MKPRRGWRFVERRERVMTESPRFGGDRFRSRNFEFASGRSRHSTATRNRTTNIANQKPQFQCFFKYLQFIDLTIFCVILEIRQKSCILRLSPPFVLHYFILSSFLKLSGMCHSALTSVLGLFRSETLGLIPLQPKCVCRVRIVRASPYSLQSKYTE